MKEDWHMVRREARKARLAGEPFVLLDWIIEYICFQRYTREDKFPVSWPMIHNWTGWSRKTAYRHRKALVKWGFLLERGEKGVPPVSLFSFFPKGAKNDHYEGAKNDHFKGAKKEAPQICNPFRKEVQEEGRKTFERPGGAEKAPEVSMAAVPADPMAGELERARFSALKAQLGGPDPTTQGRRRGRVAAK